MTLVRGGEPSRAGGVTGLAPLDVGAIRREFPILERRSRGRRLAYLDSAATAQKPRVVIEAVAEFYRTHNANVHRGVHLLGEEATALYDEARATVARFVHAASPEEIVFTRGTTEAINLLAQAWGDGAVAPGDEIAVTVLEHHSNFVPWQQLALRTGARLVVTPIHEDGALDLAAFEAALTPRTRLVAVSHVSNVLGTVLPVERIAALAHQAGAVVVVDAAQAVPHFPVDVQALGCDFLAFSGHKLYGPTGVGVLYGRRDLLERMPPWQVGGGMIETVTAERTTWAPPPARLEAGTPPLAEAVGLARAMEWLSRLGWAEVAAHEHDLLEYASAQLQAIDGLRLLGTAPEKASVISFVLGEVHPHDVATVLDVHGVAVRAGHHCAQPLMQHLGLTATVRASFAVYNDRDDVDQLVAAVEDARRRFLS